MTYWLGKVTGLMTAALILTAGSAMAESRFAEVGVYNGKGEIKLYVERFRDRFADGTPVTELDIRVVKGVIHAFRKGYGDDDACRTEHIELADESGQPLLASAPMPAGFPVFAFELSPTLRADCVDDNCHALINVPPGLLSARCDRTELSENQCRCHINDGTGERLTNGDFCDSWFEQVLNPLSYWVRLEHIVRL